MASGRPDAPAAPNIVERLPDCVITIDHHGKILEFTPAAEKVFGYRRGDAIGRGLAGLILPPSLTPRLRRRLAGHFAPGGISKGGKPFKLVARRCDGTEAPIEVSIVRLPSTVPPMFAAFVRGLGERQTDAAPAREDRAHRALIEPGPEGFALIDARGQFQFASASAAQLIGYAPEELDNRAVLDMIHPDDRERIRTMLAGLSRRPRDQATTEVRAMHKNGSWRLVEMTATNALENPAVRAIVANLRDVTPHRLLSDTPQRMEQVRELMGRLRSTQTLEETYSIICEQVLSAVHGDYAELNLLDDTRERITRVYAAGVSAVRAPRRTFNLAGTLSERIARTVTPLAGEDFWKRDPSLWPPALTEHLGPYAVVPLRFEEEVIGTYVVARRRTPAIPFVQEEVRLLETLGMIGAAAIRQVRLLKDLQRQVNRLQALYDLSYRLGAAGALDEIYELLGERAMAVSEAGYGAVALIDPRRQTLTRVFSRGAALTPRPVTFPVKGAWSEELFKTGKPRVGRDVFEGSRPAWWTRKDYGHLGPFALIPLRSKEEPIGVLLLARRRPPDGHEFTEEDVDLLKGVAEIGASALQRARLGEDLQSQVVQLQALRALSRRLRAAQRPDEIYAMLGDIIMSMPGVAYSLVALIDPGRTAFTRVYTAGTNAPPPGTTFPAEGSWSIRVLETGEPYVIDDIHKTKLSPSMDAARYADLGPCVVVPVRSEGEAIGIISAHRPRTPGRPFTDAEVRLLGSIAEIGGTAIRRAQLYQNLQAQADRLQALHDLSARLRAARTPDEMYSILGNETMSLLDAAHGAVLLVDAGGTTFTRVFSQGKGAAPAGTTFPVEGSRAGTVFRTGAAYVTDDIKKEPLPPWMTAQRYEELGPWAIAPMRSEEGIIGALSLRRAREPGRRFADEEVRLLESIAEIGGTAIRRAQLHHNLQSQIETLKSVYEASKVFAESLDLQQIAEQAVRTCVELFGVRAAWLGRKDPDGSLRMLASYPERMKFIGQIALDTVDLPESQIASARAVRTGSSAVTHDITRSPHRPPWYEQVLAEGLRSVAGFPLVSRMRTFGVLALYTDQVSFFTPDRTEFFQSYARQLAAALENARLFTEATRRLEHLQAQRAIDLAIGSNLDLRVTLNILLERTVTQLEVDAADVLLFEAASQTLNFAEGRGFRTDAIRHTHLRLGEGHAGRAALERSLVSMRDLAKAEGFVRASFFVDEGFVAYYAVPILAKGELKGVLEVFHRGPLAPQQEWLEFLTAIGGQAGIAIDNAALLGDLQQANSELMLSYERTIEGWSRALDLRDRETEGHAQRVVEMTLSLARALGVPEAEFGHIRRGALLHDIGKMGVPDAILFKPGPLTDDEWAVMRRHPVYAYELLAPIAYVRPALDIPYCHHEKWDGTGYPRGLKGEKIPLAARIFAVVDVWDALRSSRPYRRPWPAERALDYIREQSGAHFDPAVVKAFLEMAPETVAG